MGMVKNRRTRMSTDGMTTRTRTFNSFTARTCSSGGPKGNISGGGGRGGDGDDDSIQDDEDEDEVLEEDNGWGQERRRRRRRRRRSKNIRFRRTMLMSLICWISSL